MCTWSKKHSEMMKSSSVRLNVPLLLGVAPRDEVGGEFPPLSPDEFLSVSVGPAVTLKSEFSLDMR